MSNKKDGGYDESLIDEIVAVIKEKDGKEISGEDFDRIESAMKDHCYYERDEVYWDDITEYLNWNINSWERDELINLMGVTDNDYEYDEAHEMVSNVEVKTLDDVYRMELLLKLYKSTNNISELENMIRGSVVSKMSNVVL